MKKKSYRSMRIAKYILYKETMVDFKEHLWTFIGGFTGIGIIGYLSSFYFVHDYIFLIGSFGASAVLVYGHINSPLAQPRNLIGGHIISAIIGVTISYLIPNELWLACALAASLSIVIMQATQTLHPPGGATALIAIIGSEKIKKLGYWYVLSPVLVGVLVLLLVALIFNNISSQRSYPSGRSRIKMSRKRLF